MSMVYGFAAQSGGAVIIKSEVGKGTAVNIYLPRYTGDMPAKTDDDSETPVVVADVRKTILLVDDEALVRMVLAEELEELGYTIVEAGDGPTGD